MTAILHTHLRVSERNWARERANIHAMQASPASSSPRVGLDLALALCTALVVYGSLVPLDFVPLDFNTALRRFADAPWLNLGADKRADWVANGVAYLPLGLLLALLVLPRTTSTLSRLSAAALAWVICSALAVGVEFTQLFFPQRTVSLNDVAAEVIGSACGALLGVTLAPRWWPRAGWWHRLALNTRALGMTYAVALLGLGLFPFDLIISIQEWKAKLAGPNVAWWLLHDAQSRGGAALLGFMTLEVAAAAPLALLLRYRADSTTLPLLLRGLLMGAGFGLLLEGLQLLMVSTITQGSSVVTRAAGAAGGALLIRALRQRGVNSWRFSLRKALLLLVPLHLLGMAYLAGWFHAPWRPLGEAWNELETSVRFLPFYYHYFVTELEAVTSAVRVATLYAPIGLWIWGMRHPEAQGTGAVWAALAAAGCCALAEAGRLMAGLRPDPTNVLIASAAATATATFLQWISSQAAHKFDGSTHQLTTDSDTAAAAPGRRSAWAALGLLALVAVASGPWGWPLLTPLIIIITCSLAAWRPMWTPGLAAFLAMLIDPRPWAGAAPVGEFDVLMAALFAMAVWRTPRPAEPVRDARLAWVLGLLASSALIAAGHTVAHWVTTGLPWATEPLGPGRGVDAAKGLLWGVLLVVWARWGVDPQGAKPLAHSALVGLALGTMGTVGVMMWEWWALANSQGAETALRASGPLADMSNGGGSNEALLALGFAVCAGAAMQTSALPIRLCAMAAAAVAAIGMVMTYSRAAHLALVLTVGVLVAAGVWQRWRPRHAETTPTKVVCWGLGILGAAALAATLGWMVLMAAAGPGAAQRLQNLEQEVQQRLSQPWKAWALHDGSVFSTLFGMGWAAYPTVRYQQTLPHERVMLSSLDSRPEPRSQNDSRQVRITLAPGDAGSLNQVLLNPGAPHPQRLKVEVMWRPLHASADAALDVQVCRKWLLNSEGCMGKALRTRTSDASYPNPSWQRDAFELQVPADFEETRLNSLPLMMALHHGGGSALQILQVQVINPDSGAVLGGTAASSKSPRAWWAMSDAHKEWKVESGYISILWEGGVLGFAASVLLVLLLAQRTRICMRSTQLSCLVVLGTLGLWDTWTHSGRVQLILQILTLAILLKYAQHHDQKMRKSSQRAH